jgi:hypothetical protein
MTLPKRILNYLAEIDTDRTCAVVKVTEAVMGMDKRHFKPVQLVDMAPGKSLIVVGPNRILKHVPGLKLIEIAPARFLLTIPSGTPLEALEVSMNDLFHNPKVEKNEREIAILTELINLIGEQRREQRLSKAELILIDTR